MGEAKRRGSYEKRKAFPRGPQTNHMKNWIETKKWIFNYKLLGPFRVIDTKKELKEKIDETKNGKT